MYFCYQRRKTDEIGERGEHDLYVSHIHANMYLARFQRIGDPCKSGGEMRERRERFPFCVCLLGICGFFWI